MKIVTNCDAIREFRMIYFYRRRCMFPPILLIHFRSSQHTFVSLTMTLFLLMPFVMLDFVTIVPSHLLIHCLYYLDHGLVFVYWYRYHPSSWWLKLFQIKSIATTLRSKQTEVDDCLLLLDVSSTTGTTTVVAIYLNI